VRADTFERSFTEAALGLALNVGEKGRIIVKRCVADSPAGRRRIPDGAFVTMVGEQSTDHRSLAEVKKMIQARGHLPARVVPVPAAHMLSHPCGFVRTRLGDPPFDPLRAPRRRPNGR
jgi:hypothetical protein